MKYFLSFALIGFIFLACSIPKNTAGQQGISGHIFWLEGNLMPTIGDTTYQKRAAGRPAQRTVFIYEATKREQAELANIGSFYSEVNTHLIKKIKTDESGNFKVILAPGKYSIFIQEEEGLFANIFDGQGIISPATVEIGKFTDIIIKVNYKAFY